MVEFVSTVRGRQLGTELRAYMEAANLDGKQCGRILGWSESRVSRILTGKISPSDVDVASLLAIFGIFGQERDRLIQMTAKLPSSRWPHDEYERVLNTLRGEACRIFEFSWVVPELLRSAEYHAAIRERSAALLPMQRTESPVPMLFDQLRPPEGVFYVHKHALYLPFGGWQVLRDQLYHLLRLAVRKSIKIRVVPGAAGAHAGVSGACCMFEFADSPPVVAVREAVAGYLYEEPAELGAYARLFAALDTVALRQGESQSLIRQVATFASQKCDELASTENDSRQWDFDSRASV